MLVDSWEGLLVRWLEGQWLILGGGRGGEQVSIIQLNNHDNMYQYYLRAEVGGGVGLFVGGGVG